MHREQSVVSRVGVRIANRFRWKAYRNDSLSGLSFTAAMMQNVTTERAPPTQAPFHLSWRSGMCGSEVCCGKAAGK